MVPRMRTIKEVAQYFKEEDSDTAFTEYAIRKMVKTGEIASVKSGVKNLINLDLLLTNLKERESE